MIIIYTYRKFKNIKVWFLWFLFDELLRVYSVRLPLRRFVATDLLTCAIVLFIIITLLFLCESYDFYYFVQMGRFTENWESSDQSHWISCVWFNFCAHFVNNIIQYHRVFHAQFHLIEIYYIVRLVPHTQSMTSIQMWDMFIDADSLFRSLTNDWMNTVAIPLPNYTFKQSRNTFFPSLAERFTSIPFGTETCVHA